MQKKYKISLFTIFMAIIMLSGILYTYHHKFNTFSDEMKVISQKTNDEISVYTSFLKSEYTLEYGNKLAKEDLLYDKSYAKYLSDFEIDKINHSKVGDYEIKVYMNDKEYTCIIHIVDTTGPELIVQNVSIYPGQTIQGKEDFIVSASDASKIISTSLKTDYDIRWVGEQDVIIEATDEYGNTTEKTATLIVKLDKEGPAFFGLEDIIVNKNINIDYMSNVKAVDEKDGIVSFKVDNSGVDTTTPGTYFVFYTASDEFGNITDAVRKVIINTDMQVRINTVNLALSQVGNIGGKPYYNWYGYSYRIEWCAAFVSWIANEVGILDTSIPKFIAVSDGMNWFKQQKTWKNAKYQPLPGDIIFFDWENDGWPNHVGIVEKAENGTIYTIEGNVDDKLVRKEYSMNSKYIYGYGSLF